MAVDIYKKINGQKMTDPSFKVEDGKIYRTVNGNIVMGIEYEVEGQGGGGGGDCPTFTDFVNDNGDGSIESYDDGRVYARMNNLWGIDENGEYHEMGARVDLLVTNSGLPSGGQGGGGGEDCPTFTDFVNDNGDGSIESYDDGRVYARMDNLWGIDENGEYHEMGARVDLLVTNSGLPMKWTNGMKMSNWENDAIQQHLANDDFSELTEWKNMFKGAECDSVTLEDVKINNSLEYLSRESTIKTVNFINCDMSELTKLTFAFQLSSSLQSVVFENCDTSNVRDIQGMFGYCRELKSISAFDCSSVTNADRAFASTTDFVKLTDLGGFINLSVDLDLSACTALTVDSLMNVINNLATVSGKTLTLGETNLAKLTDEQKQVATDKGWILN